MQKLFVALLGRNIICCSQAAVYFGIILLRISVAVAKKDIGNEMSDKWPV